MGNAKLWVQLIAAVLAAIAPALLAGGLGFIEWVNVAILAIGAYQVWNTANPNIWPKGKAFASAAMSVLAFIPTLISNVDFSNIDISEGLNAGTIAQLVIAILAPIGVYSVRNSNTPERPVANA